MKKRKLLSLIFFASLALLTSCIDSGYDLGELDSTIQVGVNELTIPVKLENITLDRMLDLGTGGQVQEVVDPVTGEKIFAVVQRGSFESKSVDIPTFSSDKPETEKIEAEIYLQKIKKELDTFVSDSLAAIASRLGLSVSSAAVQAHKAEVQKAIWEMVPDTAYLARYPIGIHFSTFDTPVVKVHEAIRSIDYVGVTCDLSLEVRFDNLDFIDNVHIRKVRIQLPKGLDAKPSCGTYDRATGVLDLTNGDEGIVIHNGSYKFVVSLSGIDFNAPGSGAKFTTKDGGKGEFYYSSIVKILSGEMEIFKTNFINGKTFFDLPKEARFICNPEMDAITVNTFTGKINYKVDGMDAKSITMSELPDILEGDETDIMLKNPQVYLTVNDPLADEGIYAEAGVALTPMRKGVERETKSLDNGVLRIDKAENVYCLSPEKPSKFYEGYSDADWQPFSGLSSVVSGKGLPDQILVNIQNPGVPEQQVNNFVLGKEYEPIRGSYLFYAPLLLDEYSVIVYEDKESGWNKDGEFDDVTISHLKVSASINSDLPLGAKLTLTALGENGQPLPGVTFSVVQLEPNKKNQQFMFEQLTGTITGLDGVLVRASIASDGSKTLQPAQQLQLDNVRITVTGNYTSRDDD